MTFKYVVMVLVTLLILFPILWMISSSLKPTSDLFAIPPTLFPNPVSIAGYVTALSRPAFVSAITNSLIVATGSTVITLFLTLHGAYALARVRFFGRAFFAKFILCFYMFPAILLVIPIYMMMTWLQLANSLIGIMVIHTILNIPFCLWLLRAFFITIPAELEEAAIMDGASILGAFYRIIIPLSKPGIAAVSLFSFIASWSEFLLAYVLVTSNSKKTLPVVLAEEIIGFEMQWSGLLSMSVIVLIPIFIACLIFSKYLVEGLASGAVKG
jgi:ABC-type glycerol-3-phosphate transport system permease component